MINVNGLSVCKKVDNFWNNILFHPTDAIEDDWGIKILDDVAKDKVAKTVRIYAMLEDIVTMDENGNLKYDFTLNDVRMDYLIKKGFSLFVSYAFIPPCIAIDPTLTSNVSKKATRYKGKMIITSPPKDYNLWQEICYTYTKHIVERYGIDQVKTWYFQCLNEPDLGMFFMRDMPEGEDGIKYRLPEYLKLYENFYKGVERVSKELRVGQSIGCIQGFFEGFIKAAKERNFKLDFVSVHTYGTDPFALNRGDKPFTPQNHVPHIDFFLSTIKKYFPEGKPFTIDEWGAASHGFFNVEECKKLLFREGSEFAAYFAEFIRIIIDKDYPVLKMLICLSGQHEMVTDFSGFRNLFTLHHIKKPIYNAYILLEKLYSSFLEYGKSDENVTVLPTKNDSGDYAIAISYASKNYDTVLPKKNETVKIDGVKGKYGVTVWRIDDQTTNPYKLSLKNGYPEQLSPEQVAVLKEEGNLKPVKEFECEYCGSAEIPIDFSNNALVLVSLTKK